MIVPAVVAGERRRDLDRDEAVAAGAVSVDPAEHVSGTLDVGDRDVVVDRGCVEPVARQRGDVRVVVAAAEDRLLEDRGIRGDAAQRLLGDEPRELALGDQRRG